MKTIATLTLALILSACSGIAVSGRAAIERVDESQQSSKMYHRPIPLRCFFTSCEAANGSSSDSVGS